MYSFRIALEHCDQKTIENINPFADKWELHKRIIYYHNNHLLILNKCSWINWNLVIKGNDWVDIDRNEVLDIPNTEYLIHLFSILWLKPKSEHEFYSTTIYKSDTIDISIKDRPKLPRFIEIKSTHLYIIKEYAEEQWIDLNKWYYWSLSEFYSNTIWVPKEYINNLTKIDFITNLYLPDGIKLIS